MPYFRERNNLKTDYSGYGEVTQALRERLVRICKQYSGSCIGVGNEHWFLSWDDISQELGIYLNADNMETVLLNGKYDEVFEAIEIFLTAAKKECYEQRYQEIFAAFTKAFYSSGSVYNISPANHVKLQIDPNLAKNIEESKQVLKEQPSAYNLFFQTIGDFVNRKSKPKDVVKDTFVAFEDYLKGKTGTNDYGQAINKLQKDGVIGATQKALLDKIYAYRSDSYAVGHAGNSEEPKEIDALWFIDTVVAQLKLIDNKLKQS